MQHTLQPAEVTKMPFNQFSTKPQQHECYEGDLTSCYLGKATLQ
jgi:hypothetical protein